MKIISSILLAGILLATGYTMYYMYDQQCHQKSLIEQLKQDFSNLRPATGDAAINKPTTNGWNDLQSHTKDTVVQIFAHISQFNWLEPYKSPNQGQVSGTGFFISEDGLIITNAHVINEARLITIQIPHTGKERFCATLVGVSPERDLALLRLAPGELEKLTSILGKIPTLSLGDSDSVHRSDEIMALGYPLGQESLKSTTGVVSGRQHIDGHYMIQISAPINPGSSGGPSLDINGLVIGVNSAGIFGGGVQNVGYIIPSNEVKLFLRQLEQMPETSGAKFLRKPFLGVLFNNGTDSLTKFLGNPPPGGLYVVETYTGSPLHKAGVLPNDMIYEIDGHKVDVFGEMNVSWNEDKISIVDYVTRLMLGDKIKLVVYRNGKRKELVLTFGHSELAPVRGIYPAYEKIEYEIIGGLVIMQLTLNHLPLLLQRAPELAHYMELKHQMEPAIIITNIFGESTASQSRTIGAGAVIKEVNGERVKTLEELRKVLKKSCSTGFLTIKTTEGVFTALPFDKIMKEEEALSENYYYPLSPTVKEVLAQCGPQKK
ncbi:MAG: trypsin-like peptidase domain-containing protein [Candidatus Babeliaceae bacterium]|jgi:serine protease Do